MATYEDISSREKLMSREEAMGMLGGIGASTLARMTKRGEIKARALGGRVGYLYSELAEYLRNLPVVDPKRQ